MSNPVSRGFWSETAALVSAVVRAMRMTAINFIRKPITVHYPEKPRTYPDRYRGLLALTYDPATGACRGGACAGHGGLRPLTVVESAASVCWEPDHHARPLEEGP